MLLGWRRLSQFKGGVEDLKEVDAMRLDLKIDYQIQILNDGEITRTEVLYCSFLSSLPFPVVTVVSCRHCRFLSSLGDLFSSSAIASFRSGAQVPAIVILSMILSLSMLFPSLSTPNVGPAL